MRNLRLLTLLAAIAIPGGTARADSFLDLFGGMSVPLGDDDWTDLVETSPKLGLRVGAMPGNVGGYLQADWSPVSTDAESGTFPGGSTDISAHRFRVTAGALIHHDISNLLVFVARGGVGLDIAHASAELEILGNTTSRSDTDAALGFEMAGGLWFRAGSFELGAEANFPIAFHDHEAGNDGIAFEYTSYDIELLFGARFLSR